MEGLWSELNGGGDIDFMVKGLCKYKFFGQEVWITTSHVCILIVMLAIILFAVLPEGQ